MVYSNMICFVYSSWFYGKIRRAEAEQLLLQEPHDGAYLIRDSESTEGRYCNDCIYSYLLNLSNFFFIYLFMMCYFTTVKRKKKQ